MLPTLIVYWTAAVQGWESELNIAEEKMNKLADFDAGQVEIMYKLEMKNVVSQDTLIGNSQMPCRVSVMPMKMLWRAWSVVL